MATIDERISALPKRHEFAALISQVADMKREDIAALRSTTHQYYGEIMDCLDSLGLTADEDFRWEPEQLYKVLGQIQEKVGGLQGVALALVKRIQYYAYEELANLEGRKSTDKEKEMYSRSKASDMEGLSKSLDSLFTSLNNRIYTLRSSVKGAWY